MYKALKLIALYIFSTLQNMMVFHDKSLVTLEQLLCIALRVTTVHLRYYYFAINFAGKLQSLLKSLILTPTILKVRTQS